MEAKEITDRVTTSIEEISLPTYELHGENPNPVFHSQYGVAHIYPYTLQDEFATQPTEVTYDALILENCYLRVTVLPQLGGRVFSVYDKISDREVFYKNPTIKFSPLAIRGAFFSGGLEFSFPVAHSPTTAENVNWDFQHAEDGSASVVIGGLEHISGLRWTIKLSLFPNRCALAQDVQLSNPTPIPGRYHYWTNASTHSDLKTEFIYPLKRVRSYEFAGTSSWPIARLDTILSEPGLPGMEGVPMWPADRMHHPTNFRWEKNMLAQVSIFGHNVTWDFFGAWQHASNTGYAHFAPYRDVSGMKLWSWGQSEVGIVNQSALMDDGSIYAETQCGAMETQLDFDFLLPGMTRSWREWWMPLRNIGGLTCASADLGARINLTPQPDRKRVILTIALCPVTTINQGKIKLSIPNSTLLEESANFSPENPFVKKVAVEGKLLSDHPITLIVENNQGEILLNYEHDSSVFQDEKPDSPPDFSSQSADAFYQQGLQHENFDNRAEALESYRQAILTSEEHGPSHFQLGLMLLRSADFGGAKHHLQWASDLGINSANYYLGLLAWYANEPEIAQKHYQSVPEDDPLYIAAQCGIASVLFGMGDWKSAIQLLEEKQKDKESLSQSQLLLAIALRNADKLKEATDLFKNILKTDPLNLVALNELVGLEPGDVDSISDKLNRLLSDDQQYYLDLACFYLDIGLHQQAALVLKQAANGWNYPPLFYLLEFIQDPEQELDIWITRAQEGPLEYVFPSRPWEIIALQNAVNLYPGDFQAKYFLGNFYYARQRYDEAIQLWEQAHSGLDSFDVIHRNLGLAYWQQEKDQEKAIQFFKRGLDINSKNQDLYLHLDELYKEIGDNTQRSDLLNKMELLDPIREDLRKRKLAIMLDLEMEDRVLQIMADEEFVPLEMDQSFHYIYVRALLMKAQAYLNSNQVEHAIDSYKKALEFPKNHGVGRPLTLGNAEILFRLGCAYELLGEYQNAISAWQEAAQEHHKLGEDLFPYLQMSLDKLGRYSELGLDGTSIPPDSKQR